MYTTRYTSKLIGKIRKQLAAGRGKAGDLAATMDSVDAKLAALIGSSGGRRRGGDQPRNPSLGRTAGEMGRLLAILQGSDATPTTQATNAINEAKNEMNTVLSHW